MRSIINHIFNPLHIYCRLVDLGIGRDLARRMARRYESTIYRPLMA